MEDNNEVLEMEAEVTSEELDAFDESWNEDSGDDDFDLSDGAVTEDTEPTEDAQPEEEVNEESTEPEGKAEEPGEERQEGNQLFEINYLGNKEQLTLEQMTELAQKGRDYDHVRQERDNLKSETGRQLAFLKKLADKSGVSVDEQIDLTEAMWLVDEEAEKGNTITETEALLRVQRGRKDQPAEETPAEPEYHPEVAKFLKAFPEIKAEDIPQEVWDRTRELGGDLLGAYRDWRDQQTQKENASYKQQMQNKKNEKRSTGPLSGAGSKRQKDAFDEGWYS